MTDIFRKRIKKGDIMDLGTTTNPKKLETQIVVIGGGAGGLCAATIAAEKGVDVILLEKSGKTGGNAALASEIFGAESPVQKRMGIDAPRDELFKMHMDFHHWQINARLVRTLIDKSADTIRWLEEKGITFNVFEHFPGQRFWCAHAIKGAGRELVRVLTKVSEDLGVRLLCGTAAKEVLTGDNNEVIGVLATRKGEEIRIKASSVVIATGGFAGNKEMLKKYMPEYNENIALGGCPNMGDGILMAMKVGAATEGLNELFVGAKHVVGEPARAMFVLAIQRDTISVNKLGERFFDEAGATNHQAVLLQPDRVNYTLFDEAKLQKVIEENPNGFPGTGGGTSSKAEETRELLQQAADRGNAKISNSWDEIAEWMGAKPEVLKATIDEYNTFCDKGHDDVFLKNPRFLVPLRTPPYYAIRCFPKMGCTIGGIKINYRMAVLGQDYEPIPGLYAAGIDTGGWHKNAYDMNLSGHMLGFSMSGGLIAGENASEYVKHIDT
jgi:fumarate reductase flavoprotein subunit